MLTRMRYRWWQYLAASLIICGVLLSVISDIVHPQPQDVTNALAVVFVLAFVPVAVSSVLKEAAFKAGARRTDCMLSHVCAANGSVLS